MENFMNHNFTIGEITFADEVKADTATLVHKNRPSHGLALFPAGSRVFDFNEKKFRADKNTIVFFPKGSNYVIRDRQKADCYAINFQMPDGASFQPFAFKVKSVGVYLDLFRLAKTERTRKARGSDAKIKAALYEIIYNMQVEFGIPYGNTVSLEPAVEYIHKNYLQENVSVEGLADLCGVSSTHFRNCFLRKFAISPKKYIINLKLSRAKELLASKMYSVTEACYALGYTDESYFCREFKRHVGLSPSDFKRMA